MTQKIVDVLKPKEAYLLFLSKGGGRVEEFELLPRPLNAGEDVLYDACIMAIASDLAGNDVEVFSGVEKSDVWQVVLDELGRSTDVEIGGVL